MFVGIAQIIIALLSGATFKYSHDAAARSARTAAGLRTAQLRFGPTWTAGTAL